MNIPEEVKRQLANLNQQYQMELPNKIEELKNIWQHYIEDKNQDAALELYRKVHSLAGSCGIHGLTDLAKYAKEVELLVKPAFDKGTSLDANTEEKISHGLNTLSRQATATIK